MQFSLEDQASVAGLLEHPGYQTLLRLLRVREQELLNDMAHIGDTGDLVNATRYWQVFRHLVHLLDTSPQSIAAELLRVGEEQGKGYDEVISPMESWIHKHAPDLSRGPGIPPSALATPESA